MTAFVVVVVAVALLLPLLLIKRETDDDESVRIIKVFFLRVDFCGKFLS
jgi:hypothetical protein